MLDSVKQFGFRPPGDGAVIETIDMHTGGEPLRIITGGLPEIKGDTLLEKRRFFRENLDHLRRMLMWEPRGHTDMYGAILLDPVDPRADLSVLFMHNEGYSTMCGHATIALSRFVIDTGIVKKAHNDRGFLLEVPAGLVKVKHLGGARGSFENVPSFVLMQDREVTVEGVGNVSFDVAFGGAFYAFVDVEDFGFGLIPSEGSRIKALGGLIRQAIVNKYEIKHPFAEDLGFLYGVIFMGKAHDPGHHSRNVCIFADQELDRSATGSGVSARAALHHAKGELLPHQPLIIESILGTTMTVEITAETEFGKYNAVIPRISGEAFYTGKHTFWIDPDDPLKEGFMIS